MARFRGNAVANSETLKKFNVDSNNWIKHSDCTDPEKTIQAKIGYSSSDCLGEREC